MTRGQPAHLVGDLVLVLVRGRARASPLLLGLLRRRRLVVRVDQVDRVVGVGPLLLLPLDLPPPWRQASGWLRAGGRLRVRAQQLRIVLLHAAPQRAARLLPLSRRRHCRPLLLTVGLPPLPLAGPGQPTLRVIVRPLDLICIVRHRGPPVQIRRALVSAAAARAASLAPLRARALAAAAAKLLPHRRRLDRRGDARRLGGRRRRDLDAVDKIGILLDEIVVVLRLPGRGHVEKLVLGRRRALRAPAGPPPPLVAARVAVPRAAAAAAAASAALGGGGRAGAELLSLRGAARARLEGLRGSGGARGLDLGELGAPGLRAQVDLAVAAFRARVFWVRVCVSASRLVGHTTHPKVSNPTLADQTNLHPPPPPPKPRTPPLVAPVVRLCHRP